VNDPTKRFWNPYAAGFALGLVLLASFVLTGRGLGASGTFKHLGAIVLHEASPTWAEENGNIGGFFAHPGRSSLDEWIVFLSLGAAIGGGIAVLTARRFRVETIRGPRATREQRWVLAGAGGILHLGPGAHRRRAARPGELGLHVLRLRGRLCPRVVRPQAVDLR